MNGFTYDDNLVTLSFMDAADVTNALTTQNVINFLQSLGVEDISVHPGHLICPTICHNPIGTLASMKLYWYENRKGFKCYTECNEWMSIFELYQKYMNLNYHSVTFSEAVEYVKHFVTNPENIAHYTVAANYENELARYQYDAQAPEYENLSKQILTYFTNYHHPSWLQDGIADRAMDKFQIKFSIAQNKIIIPHFDIYGNLIGIRGRALNEEDIATGKYKPVIIGKKLYNHALSFNLYGLYEHKAAICKYKKVIIAEAEKSVLLDETYFGDKAICVACCGHKINKYQIDLLIRHCKVEEIIIAYDKEYENWYDEKAQRWKEDILKQCMPFKHSINFSYIWDFDNLLKEKDSPYDKGKETFIALYKKKVSIK